MVSHLYNELDTIIMVISINFVIKNCINCNVDMHKQVFAACYGVQVKYSFPNRQFNVNEKFKSLKITKLFEYTLNIIKKC
jgi:hypothetical protein